MMPLAPSYRKVLRLRALIGSVLLLFPACAAELAIARETALPPGLAVGAALLLVILIVTVLPGRRYRAWSYEEAEDELHVCRGILFRSHVIVPFGRVQHIDVAQGPIERRYDLGTLTLHTAGTRSSAVSLPGLLMADAERMRDEIRGKIRQDLV